MPITKVGNPYTYNFIKPNSDGSINIGSGVNINIGSVTAELDANAFADFAGGSCDAQIIVAGSNWYAGSFIPILGQVSKDDQSYTTATAQAPTLTTTGRLKVQSELGSLAGTGIAVNSGAASAGTQRVILASDDPAVTSLAIIDDWDETRDSACGSDGIITMALARSSQTGSVGNDDAQTVVSNLYGEQVVAGYDWSTQSNSVTESNPLSEQYVEEELIDTTNVTAATNYYPSSAGLTLGGYKDFCVQGVISGGVTATIEVTLDDAASPDWLDITKAGFEMVTNTTNNTSFVDTSFVLDFDNLNVKAVRVKSVTSDATNGVQYHIRRKSI